MSTGFRLSAGLIGDGVQRRLTIDVSGSVISDYHLPAASDDSPDEGPLSRCDPIHPPISRGMGNRIFLGI